MQKILVQSYYRMHIYAVVCRNRKSICVCVCVCESGFVEDAFVCFKMWFCLVFNILLYCHIIDKSDRRK